MAERESSILRELLRSVIRHLGILEKNDASCFGLSLTQCHALVEVGRRGKINLNELAAILLVDKSTMSRTVNNLVEAGLAARNLDDGDRRYVVIQLTQSGQSLFEDIEIGMERYFQTVLSRIPEHKREQVLDSLSMLTTAIGEERCCQYATPKQRQPMQKEADHIAMPLSGQARPIT